jgi:hypothetical protein
MKNFRLFILTLLLLFLLPVSATQFRDVPYFPNFKSEYVVRGVIVENVLFYHSPYVDLYSPKIKIIDDFDLGIKNTIILLPDTTGMNSNSWFFETGRFLKEGEEYFVDYRINRYGQKCYTRFLEITDGKVIGNLTNWQEFLIKRFRISPRGMRIERFEKKLKKKIDRINKGDNKTK